ncbi:MAG: CHAT domain-containing protein [Crocosphaera sp.]
MQTILILAANPRKDLDLRREIHILKSVIQRSQSQDKFEVQIGSGVNSQEIQTLFLEHKPRIVHFCGHGAGKNGLVFEDNKNTETLVSKEALADLFDIFSNQVECVLLNACYSDIQASEISHHINYVIGMIQAIRDDAAIVFARGFYEALADGQSIEISYKLGCNTIERQLGNNDTYSSNTSNTGRKISNPKLISKTLPEHLKPQLKIKSNLTPFSDVKELTASTTLPDVKELVEDEINRKKYREDIEADFNLGRNNVNRQQPLSQEKYRSREVLLSRVEDDWIKGVLQKSLFTQVLFEQEIIEHPDAVERPFTVFEEPAIELEKSFEFIQASDIFEEMGAGRTLLILGEPGTGKTLSMLKLAERLIKKCKKDLSLPIPVVFNLSSWAIKRQKIADWLIEELKDKYKVSKDLGKQWIEQEALILLLDGLDEVKANYRNDCVKALNQFLDDHGITETVICCRVKDYETLSERLKLRNAICIQLLSSEYINWYLEDVGKPLLGLKKLLQQDKELEEFARTPLIFSVMSITYQGYSLDALLQEMSVKEKRYKKLFDKYVNTMFDRKKYIKSHYNQKNAKKWLTFLAKKMEKQDIFYIDKIQISWLFKDIKNTKNVKNKKIKNKLLGAVLGMVYGRFAIKTIINLFIFTESSLFQLLFTVVAFTVFITIGWFIGGLFNSSNQNQKRKTIDDQIPEMSFDRIPEEIPKWSWKRLLWALIVGIIAWLETIIVFSLVIGIFDLALFKSLFGWQFGFFFGILSGFFKSIFLSINSFLDKKIKIVDTLRWSWKKFRFRFVNTFYISFFLKTLRCIYINHKKLYYRFLDFCSTSYRTFMVITLLLSIVIVFFFPILLLFSILLIPLIPMSFVGLLAALLNALAVGAEIEEKTYPNQGIWNSFKNANMGLLYGLIIGMIFMIPITLSDEEMSFDIHTAIMASLTWGLMAGSFISLSVGSKSFMQHIALRIILYFQGDSPLNYANFLNYATERLFMYKVGGGYIFIHRMLMEHFANMKLDESD